MQLRSASLRPCRGPNVRYTPRLSEDESPGRSPIRTATARACNSAPISSPSILDFGDRGWLVIDPKGLIGERGFDYANLFCNPETDIGVTAPDRFRRRLAIVTEASGIKRERLLQWILAWAGLSAAWWLSDGVHPEVNFKIAELAARELSLSPSSSMGRGPG